MVRLRVGREPNIVNDHRRVFSATPRFPEHSPTCGAFKTTRGDDPDARRSQAAHAGLHARGGCRATCRSCSCGPPTASTAGRDRFQTSLKELADDGYLFAFQDIRGKFKSEGDVRDDPTPARPGRPQGDRRGDRRL